MLPSSQKLFNHLKQNLLIPQLLMFIDELFGDYLDLERKSGTLTSGSKCWSGRYTPGAPPWVALLRLTCLQLVREARRNLHLGRDRRLVGGFGVPSITSSKGSSL